MIADFQFVTDTSTLCVFDLQCAKHRLSDDPDWWSIPEDELLEVNEGNIAFLGLGADGLYRVMVSEIAPPRGVQLHVKCPSGKIFIGAAEEVTSDGLEPEGIRGGEFLNLPPGSYLLSAAKTAHDSIVIHFKRLEAGAKNGFTALVVLPFGDPSV